VDLQRMAVPEEFPGAHFDLVLMSEVGYYWSREDLARVCQKIAGALRPGGLWLLVHWTPPVRDYPLTGDEVHEQVLHFATQSGGLRRLAGRREDSYRLDLLQRLDARQEVGAMA
jgi:SAM-dependent methyltransferase